MEDAPRVISVREETQLPHHVLRGLTTQQRVRASAYSVHLDNTVNQRAWIHQLDYAMKGICAKEETRLLGVKMDRATQKLATALRVL